MNNLTVFADNLLDRSNYNELLKTCTHALDRISGLGPSDNDVRMIVKSMGENRFMVSIKMASTALAFSLQIIAKSPIKAVEAAMTQAVSRVKCWSLARADI